MPEGNERVTNESRHRVLRRDSSLGLLHELLRLGLVRDIDVHGKIDAGENGRHAHPNDVESASMVWAFDEADMWIGGRKLGGMTVVEDQSDAYGSKRDRNDTKKE